MICNVFEKIYWWWFFKIRHGKLIYKFGNLTCGNFKPSRGKRGEESER